MSSLNFTVFVTSSWETLASTVQYQNEIEVVVRLLCTQPHTLRLKCWLLANRTLSL